MPRGGNPYKAMKEKYTEEEMAEIAKKRGESIHRTAERKKSLRMAMECIMKQKVSADDLPKLVASTLHRFGIPDEEIDGYYGVAAAMLAKSLKGDVKAAEFVRDTAGEKPTNKVDVAVSDVPDDMRMMTDAQLMELIARAGEKGE